MISDEEQIDLNETPATCKTMFLIDNSGTINEKNNKLQIQIEVCNYMFSHKYTENVQFGIATSGSEEFGVRCSPTSSLRAPKIVLDNIHSLGVCQLFDALKRTALCFIKKKENEINRIHCFLNDEFDISAEKMTKIKNILTKYNIIIDLFVICDHDVNIEKYQNILSEKSLFKTYIIQDQNSFIISQSIIDEIFDLYSDHLILNENENANEEHLNDQNDVNDAIKPPKRKRKRVQASDAHTIYQLFINKSDKIAKETCDSLGYSESTYYNIINNEGHVQEKYKNPDRKKKWENQHIEKAIEIIGDNPVLTLEEIIEKTVSETDAKNIGKSTLSDYLKTELITLKTVRLDPIARNSSETKASRKKYCNDVLRNMHKTYIYIDEMGFSACTQRNRGRSKRGTKCVRKGPLLKAPNVSICMAVSKEDCVVHYSVKDNAFDGESFATFIDELIQKCKVLNHEKICFVMDNVRMHKTEDRIREQCSANDIDLLFLPVYSPELNPIEHVFSVLKAHIKKLLRTKYNDQLLESQKAPWGLKARTREKIINDALNDSLPVINKELMKELWEDMLKVFGKVFDDEDI